MICCNAFSCTDFSLTFRSFQWFFILCNMYHMMISWLSKEHVIAKYICFFVVIDEFQVDSMIVCMIFCLITSFTLTWYCNFSSFVMKSDDVMTMKSLQSCSQNIKKSWIIDRWMICVSNIIDRWMIYQIDRQVIEHNCTIKTSPHSTQ